MKYLAALLVGMFCGAAALAVVLYYNPFVVSNNLSPLSVTDSEVVHLSYSAAASDSFIYTNDGESQISPHPAKVLQLWEPTVRQTSARVTQLFDGRGSAAGFGVKFSSASERTSLLDGEILVDSVWHIYLPERGSLFIEQTENYWNYARDIVVPAYRSSGNNWRGIWLGNITHGPGALGTAWVAGGNGQFAGIDMEAVEALSAKAYSVADGPVGVSGEITVELQRRERAQSLSSEVQPVPQGQ
ncbi:MAG: hypothetical protein OEW64_03765 [Gammaproteobacteria bacterium]|nr:hypothetical protein [Gammaproteobacteria bacterium]MDH5303195.1 hypothetical protein [Gammaproteobacteria bacterium]MDH5320797.1 hypothetical protein [Gammaproteobacteria bacterium]